jgi:uncharacterized membrane protein
MRRFVHRKAAWDYLRGALWVLALQIASSQFSPRLLRGFLRDRGNQVVLSVVVGTFAYATAGLHTVGARETAQPADFDAVLADAEAALRTVGAAPYRSGPVGGEGPDRLHLAESGSPGLAKT